MKRKKILFPTDFSVPATNAFQYALQLADKIGADVQVIHAIYPDVEPLDLSMVITQASRAKIEIGLASMRSFVKTVVEATRSKLEHDPALLTDVLVGTPVQTILDASKRESADMIVMGTRGEQRGIVKWLGSVAADVVKRAEIPVLVVPEDCELREPMHIAYAAEMNSADPFEIWKVMELFESMDILLRCVHFNQTAELTDNYEKMEQMKAFFSGRVPTIPIHFHHLPGKQLTDDLNDFVDKYEMDLLVMYQPQRGFLEGLFHRSDSKKMAVHTHVPLLVQKENN
ncbi:MAG: universal stress protein [Bacteroidota bacterium]